MPDRARHDPRAARSRRASSDPCGVNRFRPRAPPSSTRMHGGPIAAGRQCAGVQRDPRASMPCTARRARGPRPWYRPAQRSAARIAACWPGPTARGISLPPAPALSRLARGPAPTPRARRAIPAAATPSSLSGTVDAPAGPSSGRDRAVDRVATRPRVPPAWPPTDGDGAPALRSP